MFDRDNSNVAESSGLLLPMMSLIGQYSETLRSKTLLQRPTDVITSVKDLQREMTRFRSSRLILEIVGESSVRSVMVSHLLRVCMHRVSFICEDICSSSLLMNDEVQISRSSYDL